MFMKRIIAFILMLTLVLALGSCNSAAVTSNTTGLPTIQQAPEEYTSFEAFEAHEKSLGEKALSYYYIPGNLTEDYEFSKITKRDSVYVTAIYNVSESKAVSTENLDGYYAERLGTLICQYYLFDDSNVTLQSFIENGYEAAEYEGKVYYRRDEHVDGTPDKQTIGYEIAFIEEGKMIYMHLPAVDTFENMMKFADVIKVNID
jgi:uncharacterized membrane protein